MSYSYDQSREQQAPQTQESPTQEAPAQDALGNAARTEEAGLMGGLAAKAMDLTGPMAEMILECMPVDSALEAARHHLDNPVVLQWARKLDPTPIIGNLGARAIEVLKPLWPVGTGLDAEGEIAGELLVGVGVLGKASLIRTGDSIIQANVELFEGLEIGVGAGAQVTNAFDDRIVGLIAEYGASVGLRSTNQLTLDIDWLQMLAASAEIGKFNMAQVLSGELPSMGIMNLIQPESVFRKLINMTQGAQWTSQEAVELSEGVEAAAALTPDAETLALAFPQSFPKIGQLLLGFAPILEASAGREIRLFFGDAQHAGVEISGDLSGMGQVLAAIPGLEGALDGTALEALQGLASGTCSATLRFSVPTGLGGMAPADAVTATMTLSSAAETGGIAVEDGLQIPLADLGSYLMAGGDLDTILAAGAAPDITRSVGMDVPVAQLREIFPGWLEDIIGGADIPNMTEQVLRLEGSATLPGWALGCLQGRGIQVPGTALAVSGMAQIAAASMGIAMGKGQGSVPDWLAGHEDALVGMSLNVQMTEARLVGHVHIGLGGGVEGEALVKEGFEGRGQGGLAVDRPVEGAQAQQVLKALSGQEAA